MRFLAALALAGTAVAVTAPAHAAELKAGLLTCHVASGWGFVFGSTKDLRCVFQPAEGAVERYHGTINKFGVDLG